MSFKFLGFLSIFSLAAFPVALFGLDEVQTKPADAAPTEIKAFTIDFKALTLGQTWTGSGSITEPIAEPKVPTPPVKKDPKTGKPLPPPPGPPPKPKDPTSWQKISIAWDAKGTATGSCVGTIQRVGPGGYSSHSNAYNFTVTYKGVNGPTSMSIKGSFDSAMITFKGTADVSGLGKGEVELKRPEPKIPDASYAGAWTCDLTPINKALIDDFSKEMTITLPKDKTAAPRATMPANAQIDVYPFRWTEATRELILAVEYKAKDSKTLVRGTIAGTIDEKKTTYTAWMKIGTILDSKLILTRPEPKTK
jgi:hypothetical protein